MRNVIILIILAAAICGCSEDECKGCPMLMPPGPEFCTDGIIIPGGEDICGCPVAPSCELPERACTECPMLMPPGPEFCTDGIILSGGTDECGCNLPPRCERENLCQKDDRPKACTKEYMPVCGWFGEDIQCIRYPCASTFSNPCMACQSDAVAYWTEGECPSG